jgi:preprotein translocase subunit SecB
MAKKKTIGAASPMDIAAVTGWIAQHVQIIDVRLVESSSFQRLRVGPFPTNAEQEVQVEIGFEEESHRMFSRFNFILRVRYSDAAASDGPAVMISGKYQVTYSVAAYDGVTKKQAAMFCQAQGVTTSWPFWREFANSMTSRMGLPPVTLQLMLPSKHLQKVPPTLASSAVKPKPKTRRSKRRSP